VRRIVHAVVIAVLLAAAAQAQTSRFHLTAGCTLPFASIAPTSDAFASCDNSGRSIGGPLPALTKRLESQAKNNFCADTSEVVPMHFEDFSRLEANTDRTQLDLKSSRSDLAVVPGVVVHGHEVGEGTVVQFVAMMRAAHISDCRKPAPGKSGGEAVNCNQLGMDKNDIHIVLMPLDATEHTSECDSVTAEMIPHFRPAAWNDLDLRTPTENPVRLTGPLFYDNSHTACVDGKGSPARRTVWEIHPAYGLEVCQKTTEAECKVDSTTAWVPYDQWVRQPGVSVTATGKKQRSACEASVKHSATGPCSHCFVESELTWQRCQRSIATERRYRIGP
jgi:hypothetical protein